MKMSSDKIQPSAIWKKAASTSIIPIATILRDCNNDQEESASSARRIPKPSSGTSTTTIRSHSPRKIKTQTAKLVYNPSTTTKSNRNDVNENEKTVIVAAAEVDEFQKKRQDRDREVKEIHEMLNEITKTPTKQKNTTIEEAPPKAVEVAKKSQPKQPMHTIQRSKTDTNLRRPTARKIQPRQESQTARCKSVVHAEENNSPPKQRQKTYNSEDAQRYMQEQKKKRRSLQTAMQSSTSKPAIDKDEIKKRLENLRQNTRKIVNKNVKLAKKKAGVAEDKQIPRRAEIRNGLNKESEDPLKTSLPEIWPEKVLKAPSPRRDNISIEFSAKTSRIEAWTDKVRAVNANSPSELRKDPSPLAENYKKIGLLRKPEFKDHSFSAIKDIDMDKENQILDSLTPTLLGLPTSRIAPTEGTNILSNVITPPQILEQPASVPKEGVKQQSMMNSIKHLEPKPSESSLKRKSSQDLDLQVPEAKLRSRVSVREKSVQADSVALGPSKAFKKNTELPYWLKPTLVQAYPYNFIMAVRKKLEAIANPHVVGSSSSSSMEHQVAKKTAIETPVSYPKTNRNNNVKRRIIDNEIDKSLAKSVEKISSNKENMGEPRLSKSFSEVTSNFSSISIKLPDSNNTITDLKIKPQQFDDDATTVSSSVFSSPEKKKNFNGKSKNFQPEALSPLSMENISNLHIKSKSMIGNITMERGDDFENKESSHRKADSGSITNSNRSGGSVDFSKLLDDFNRSLSQVIEVNQQLKTTLVKSQVFSPEKKTTSILTGNRVELAEYVSDFEESSNADENLESNNSHGTQSISSVHEIQQSSNKSSEINTQKSSSASSSNEEVLEEEVSQRSTNQSAISLGTQTFIVPSDEKGQNSSRTHTIFEEAIEESPNKENMSINQYSLDSLETSQHEDYIKSHINTSRGDYERIEFSAGPPPSYKVSSESQARSSPNFVNTSLDSEFVRIFNKSDMEISVLSLNRSLSESTVNYSSIGMYEKLIQNETYKSEHLAGLLKMREKALIDRTKGQIAWLELQKERYKSKGLILQISAVKKKQRGILLKMEKEREEIKKLLQRAKVQKDGNKLRIPQIRPFSDVTLLQQRRTGTQVSGNSQQKQEHQNQPQQQQQQKPSSARSKSSAIVRGYELETSRSLEQLLQKREEDLRRRREHVERLMEWHRRLDQEEAEVLQLERILLDYNNVHVEQQEHQQQNAVPQRNPNQTKMEKKLRDIDRSLRELSSMSGADGSTDAVVSSSEFVRTSGTKLNKLWRRLTSQRIEKFQPNKRYKLCRADVEQLYEDAKLAVLHDFGENTGQMEVFLGQTSIISTPQPSNNSMEIPQLNLNFSSGQSEEELMRGNYSPSAAEQGFVVPSTSSPDNISDDSSSKRRGTSRNSSSSAVQSLPECYSFNSNGQRRLESTQKYEEPSVTSKFVSDTGLSTKSGNVSNISINYVLSSKTDSQEEPRVTRTSDSIKVKNKSLPYRNSNSKRDNGMFEISKTENSRSFVPSKIGIGTNQANNNASTKSCVAENKIEHYKISSHSDNEPVDLTKNSTNTLESIEYLASSIPELSLSANSIETLNNQIEKSAVHSLADISKGTAPEISQINFKMETISSSYSGNTKAQDSFSKFIESDNTKMHLSESISTESNLQSRLENSSKTEKEHSNERSLAMSKTSDRTVGSVNSFTEDISKNSENVPITDINTPPVESLKTGSSSIKSQTLNSVSVSRSNSSKDYAPLPDFGKKIDDKPSSSHSESRSLTKTEAGTNNVEVLPKSCSLKSSEECATVSILKSLLNSTYNSSSIFASNQASNTANEIQSQFRTNGHDFQNWTTKNLIQTTTEDSPSSLNDEQSIAATQVSPTESLTYPDEATLKSIKSIDNSTNSKHSINPAPNPIIIGNEEEDINLNQITNHQSYSSTFEDSVSSNQIRSSVIISIKTPPFQVEGGESEPLTNAFYESDFTEGEETNIEDISLPKFETTAEEEQFNESESEPAENTTDFERRLIDLDVSLKDLDATFEKALSPEKTPSPPRDDEGKKNQQQNDSALMPDIISEAELRRRHQAMHENELKQFEHAVPYMYVREIPNKPPPPYVPPAHGSPMTTIFPSEERIKDITFRRTKELYHEILNIDTKDEQGKKPPSVLDENITNIYERIILDICKEYLNEYKPILTSSDPSNFHSSLAFFNPPDRLRCMQDFIYKEIRKNLAMDKNAPEKSQLYSVYGHRGKRDHIGEIIIQEMYEEDNIWSNFYVEEEEVLELIIDEMVGATVRDICNAVLWEDEAPRDSITPTPGAVESGEMRCNNST